MINIKSNRGLKMFLSVFDVSRNPSFVTLYIKCSSNECDLYKVGLERILPDNLRKFNETN